MLHVRFGFLKIHTDAQKPFFLTKSTFNLWKGVRGDIIIYMIKVLSTIIILNNNSYTHHLDDKNNGEMILATVLPLTWFSNGTKLQPV